MTEIIKESLDAIHINNINSDPKTNSNNNIEDDCDQVDPWNVTSKSDTGIDYDKLIS